MYRDDQICYLKVDANDHVSLLNQMDNERTKLLDSLHELSNILETGLDRETLSILLELTESGVNPEALAALVKELRKQKAEDEEEAPSFFKI